MKLIKIEKYLLFVMYIAAMYSVVVVKNNIYYNEFTTYYVLNIAITWIPLIVLCIIAFIYSLFMCSKELLCIRKYIYGSLFFQLCIITVIMLPMDTFVKIHWALWAVVISVAFIISGICDYKIEKYISSIQISLDEEMKIMEETKKAMEQKPNYKYSKFFNRMWFFYIIPYCFNANAIIYSIFILVTAIVSCYFLFKLRPDYKSAFGLLEEKKMFVRNIIFFWNCIIIGIILYIVLSFKYPSFIMIFASFLPKYICDNRYALKLRDKIGKNI